MTRRAVRSRRTGRRGSALVELALVLPMLLTLLIGMLEFGLLGMRHMTLTGAVRAGVDYAFLHDDAAGTTRTVRSAAGSEAVGVTSSRFCECAGASAVCGGVCAGGAAQQVFVTVTAQEAYVPIFLSHEMIASLLGPTTTVSARATFRIQ